MPDRPSPSASITWSRVKRATLKVRVPSTARSARVCSRTAASSNRPTSRRWRSSKRALVVTVRQNLEPAGDHTSWRSADPRRDRVPQTRYSRGSNVTVKDLRGPGHAADAGGRAARVDARRSDRSRIERHAHLDRRILLHPETAAPDDGRRIGDARRRDERRAHRRARHAPRRHRRQAGRSRSTPKATIRSTSRCRPRDSVEALAIDSRLVVPEGLPEVKTRNEQRASGRVGSGGPTTTPRASRAEMTIRINDGAATSPSSPPPAPPAPPAPPRPPRLNARVWTWWAARR